MRSVGFFNCILIFVLFILGVGCAGVDLSSPESTIMGYCKGAGEKVQEYFDPFYEPVTPDKFGDGWEGCKIIEVKPTDLVGKKFQKNLIIQKGDVNLIKEVDERGADGKTFKNQYFYILRNFNGKWKIISHSIITDNPKGITEDKCPCETTPHSHGTSPFSQ